MDRDLEKIKTAIAAGIIRHTRFRPCRLAEGGGDVYVYQRDTTSPTGVTLFASVENTPEAKAFFDSLIGTGLSPLSPSENR